MHVDSCVFKYTAQTENTLEKERKKERGSDRETEPGCCHQASSSALSLLDSHAVKLDGALGAEHG